MLMGQVLLEVTRLSSINRIVDANSFVDLEFHANEDGLQLPPKTIIRLLDTICTSHVPIHYLAGPPTDVYSNNTNTQKWLLELLSFQEDLSPNSSSQSTGWWGRPASQSSVGYLLKLEHVEDEAVKDPPKLTELLLYAAALNEGPNGATLPTPPPSSPSPRGALEIRRSENLPAAPSIVFHALPLNSSTTRIVRRNRPPFAPGEHVGPYFINIDLFGTGHNFDSSRRREMTSVFDNASLRRKRLKRKGGEAVGQMIKEQGNRPVLYRDHQRFTKDTRIDAICTDKGILDDKVWAPQLSRSLSINSAPSESIARPVTKQRMCLKRSQSQLEKDQSALLAPGPPLPSQNANAMERQNKSLISRIIMAGMRMYGLKQRKNIVQRTDSITEDGSAALSNKNEELEEYKLVYHQTLKAAIFAFRRQICRRVLTADDLQDNIDRLLAMFCSNPFDLESSQRATQGNFGTDSTDTLNAFDEPTTPFCGNSVQILSTNTKSDGVRLSG